jgi:hypothetical protein
MWGNVGIDPPVDRLIEAAQVEFSFGLGGRRPRGLCGEAHGSFTWEI